MPISEHLKTFAGFTVRDFDPKTGITDTHNTIYRIRLDPDAVTPPPKAKGFLGGLFGKKQAEPPPPPPDPFEALLADRSSRDLKGIVYGYWLKDFDTEISSEGVVKQIAGAASALPNLKALFIGDMTYEECEISWIHQGDVTPLLRAYPQLEHFGVRGSDGLKVGPVRHSNLKSLVIQCGGLPTAILKEVLQSELPALEHLELWLGEDNYGADIKIGDLEPLLSGILFPKLQYLGLRDSEIADEVASAMAKAPILNRVKTLDLSMGNLSDAGAKALLESPSVARLAKLDIHHHYVSPELVQRLQKMGPQVDASEKQEPDEYDGEECRYIAVGE